LDEGSKPQETANATDAVEVAEIDGFKKKPDPCKILLFQKDFAQPL
jgi:hypothetical protein